MIETSLLLTIIGTFVTCEEACCNRYDKVLKFFKWRSIKRKKWDSDEPVVQSCLSEFKCNEASEFSYSLLSENEIDSIAEKFMRENGYDKTLNWYCKSKLKKEVVSILKSFNEYINSVMTDGEKVLHKDMRKGFKKIGEKIDAISEKHSNKDWEMIIQKMNDRSCDMSNFGTFIVGKCNGFLEKVVMLFPYVTFENKNKYEALFRQSCMELKWSNVYEIVINALSASFDEFVNRYKGENGFYYSPEYVALLKRNNVVPQSSVNIDSIINSIVAGLKKGYRWENENVLSEYVEYFFDVLTDEHVVKLAEPYIEIFIDNARRERSSYDSSVFKNKEIAKKIIDKCKKITNAKNSILYPAIKQFFSNRKTPMMSSSEFKECMWRDFCSKLYDLGIDKKEFFQIPI
jgi:hypothetical protein